MKKAGRYIAYFCAFLAAAFVGIVIHDIWMWNQAFICVENRTSQTVIEVQVGAEAKGSARTPLGQLQPKERKCGRVFPQGEASGIVEYAIGSSKFSSGSGYLESSGGYSNGVVIDDDGPRTVVAESMFFGKAIMAMSRSRTDR